MDIIIFLFVSFILLCILLIHSYRFKGFLATLNFFLFAFLLIFTKGECPGLYFIDLNTKLGYLPIYLYIAAVFMGLSILYASWVITEKIMQNFNSLKEKILPTVLISGVICGCFIYAIGAASLNRGWLGKDEGVLSYVVLQWFFFCEYFLSAFFLITYTELKKYDWKTIFFILPLIPSWISRVFLDWRALFSVECVILILLISLLAITNLRFDYSEIIKK